MLIRLIRLSAHHSILYTLTFPDNLPDLPIPPAWSNQLHLLTSVLRFDSPHDIHVFDRSVGLVAMICDLTYDLPAREVTVNFIDGRSVKIPMNAQCTQMLHSVVDDVQTCTEQETQRDNLEETFASVCSSVASSQDIPSILSAPQKSPKGRHKRQRSLLFSLISALVPRSMSPPPAPPPSPTTPTPPPPSPLPPIPPITPRNASLPPIPQSPISPYNPTFIPDADPGILRCRARATLIDAWRRHIVPALSAHNHYAGYTEWVLRGFGARVHNQVRDLERSLQRCGGRGRGAARKHSRARSEAGAALDYGERGSEAQRRWRSPSPFPVEGESDHDDCVVYPRNEQANTWNIRHVRNPSSGDELDAYAFEFSEENDSLLRESFGFGADVYGDWDDDDHGIFDDFSALCSGAEFVFDDGRLRFDEDFVSDYEGKDYLANSAFATTPSDATEEDDSDESQSSLRTPEDGEPLSLPLPAALPGLSKHGACFQQRNHSDSVSTAVSKTTSSRPKARPLQSSYRSPNSPQKPVRSPFSTSRLPKRKPIPNMEEILSSRLLLLSRIRSMLTFVRSRAHEERWGSVQSQNPFGCSLLDPETERQLETKARRRAWSAGIRVSATSPALVPVAVPGSTPGAMVWDGSVPSSLHFPHGPPGLAPPMTQVNGPIIPAGLSLGRPIRRSPLGMYVRSADDVDPACSGKYGSIGLKRGEETAVLKRPLRVSFLDSPTKLFPVREEGDNEQGSLEGNGYKIDFPQSPTSPTSPTSAVLDERFCISEGDPSATVEDENQDDPFFCSPFQMRTRTTSMYRGPSSQSTLSSQVLPMFRPRTPPPSYQAAIGEHNASFEEESDTGTLDACALLCQPLSTLRLKSPTPTRPPLVPNPTFAPRVRSRSLPTTSQSSSLSQSISKDEDCQDLSRAYATPPSPATPITAAPTISLTEPFLTYAHLHAPVPIGGKGSVAKGRKGKEIASQEVIFERNGEEYTLGLEVALGRAEEGRSVW
ncbi:hypothetical protein K503DRAFT_855366 [Rhizopogon vinicolor AM-OR11-026]|uniref:Uncharacterized protein n=1 Tax=Rhizopogon vinicolor AM-OR11-026 TaxID=1314800 RepID=A0A1B7N6C1_9AGAM|nr:hypothetical protein K503DRAFT_855366 [Rhizopogon vinicolor AM-OR11-026]